MSSCVGMYGRGIVGENWMRRPDNVKLRREVKPLSAISRHVCGRLLLTNLRCMDSVVSGSSRIHSEHVLSSCSWSVFGTESWKKKENVFTFLEMVLTVFKYTAKACLVCSTWKE